MSRWWWRACGVWAGFNLLFGPLTGPDTWKQRLTQAAVLPLIGALAAPLIRLLQFRRIYREEGRAGVLSHIGAIAFICAVFFGPATAYCLGYPKVRDALIWVMVVMICVVGPLTFIVNLLVSVVRLLVRLMRRLRPAGPEGMRPPGR